MISGQKSSLIQKMNRSGSVAATLPRPSDAIGSPGRQQQREASVEGNRSVSIGRIVLGEGVETEGEQEYGYELFHVERF